MEIGRHRSIRNCEGKFPESHWAKTGKEIGPVKIYQCPKTFISIEARIHLDAYDASKTLNMPWYKDIGEAPAIFIDLVELIEKERILIRRGRQSNEENRKDIHGKL